MQTQLKLIFKTTQDRKLFCTTTTRTATPPGK